MGDLKTIIQNGDLVKPTENSSILIDNISDSEIDQLINLGEVIVSDHKGNAFVITIPHDLVKSNKNIESHQISIVKIPYQFKK